jgi:hypothetical protein
MCWMPATWFEQLTGFPEVSYADTQAQLFVDGDELVSRVNGARYRVGTLSLMTLAELRSFVVPEGVRSTLTSLVGDARALHSDPEFNGATIQVASQFNVLEMTGPSITPEEGVTRYQYDPTQGPACAIAAGAATIYRNYFAPVGEQIGQTHDHQLDTLAPLGAALAQRLGRPVTELWTMQNGYALCTEAGLTAVSAVLSECTDVERDALRGLLAVGLHRDVQVTDVLDGPRPYVTQVFCSALPVSYGVRSPAWEPFARLVLEACYEATLLASTQRPGSRTVLLTRVGGGAFGNDDAWIDDALDRALRIVEHAGLDIRLVSRGEVHPSFRRLIADWAT